MSRVTPSDGISLIQSLINSLIYLPLTQSVTLWEIHWVIHKTVFVVLSRYLPSSHSLSVQDNQKDLENATEQLSEYLEREITSDILVDIKQKVQDKSRYCENRRSVLLSHCHEGYEKEFWEYQQADMIGFWYGQL